MPCEPRSAETNPFDRTICEFTDQSLTVPVEADAAVGDDEAAGSGRVPPGLNPAALVDARLRSRSSCGVHGRALMIDALHTGSLATSRASRDARKARPARAGW